MPLILLFVGGILIVAAYNDAVGGLASELETDIPGFLKWGLAVGAVGAIGWIPGAQTISRWLLGLVFLVLFITQNANILAGFKALGGATSPGAAGGAVTPAAAYIANPNNPNITSAGIYGDVGTAGTQGATTSSAQAVSINAAGQPATIPVSPYDPSAFLAAFEAGFGGFGGVA